MLFASNQDREGMQLVESLMKENLSDKENGASKDEALAMYKEGIKLLQGLFLLND